VLFYLPLTVYYSLTDILESSLGNRKGTGMLRRLVATTPTWFTVPLRLTAGFLFALHGAEKVFGINGGIGLSKWTAMTDAAAGLRPAWLWLGAAAFFELVGGILILVGFLTRLGALMLIPVMLVAIYSGLSADKDGPLISLQMIGYPLAMLGALIALVMAGGGRASIDESMARSRRWR
jgi:putative oxidoreductase